MLAGSTGSLLVQSDIAFVRARVAHQPTSFFQFQAGNAMTLYGPGAKKLGKVCAILGGIAFLVCLIWTAYEGGSTGSFADCRDKLSAPAATNATAADEAGVLRIVDFWPQTAQLSGQLCLVVAGAAAKPTDAESGAGGNRAPVDIALFLNDHRVPLTVKATAAPRPQIVAFEFGQNVDATSDAGKFWRSLLAGHTVKGVIQLSVGVSKSASGGPEAIAVSPLKLVIYRVPILALGGLSMVLLIFAFVVFAANSTVLRDNALTMRDSTRMAKARTAATTAKAASDAAPNDQPLKARSDEAAAALQALERFADQPAGTFSLGRTQMALWLGLSTAGFIFLWLTLGFYLNVITASILVLLGINGATGLAAIALDQPAGAGGAPVPAESKSFLSDLMCDSDGAKLQRIQVGIWTCILAVIFFWNAVWNFVFVDFDTNLLLLMGIANTMYLGFKTREKS